MSARLRTLAMYGLWALLLALYLAGVYAVVVVVGGAIFGTGGEPSTGLTIAATVVAAVTFGWVRTRTRRIASRIVLGQQVTPLEILGRFSQRIAGAYATEDMLPEVAEVLVDGTSAARAEVWVVVGSTLRRVSTAGPDQPTDEEPSERPAPQLPAGDFVVPVQHEGDLLGAIALHQGAREFTAPEENLVIDLASQAALVLRNVRLQEELAARRDELAAQTDELRQSRRRIVAEQTDERRRLERNIHDGAQQHLVALLVRIGLASDLAESDPTGAAEELGELQGLAAEALDTLEELARGLHPRELREGGLAATLEARAREAPTGLTVTVDVADLGRHPTEVEAAVYFAAMEALQNTAKYAGPARAEIRVRALDEALDFVVTDDGRGFDPATVAPGSGLKNLTDRLAALGGTIEVTSAPGAGTTVTGRVPLVSR